MSDIKKGYTFTDKSTDWASNKDTAIRLNKMMDEAEVNLVAGTNVTITPTANGPKIDVTGSGTGTVTSIDVDGGTGISVSPAGPITTAGVFTVTNTAPDLTVSLSGGTGITTSGTYPNFTVTNSAPDQTVALTQGGTTTITGTYPNFTISSADQYTGTVTGVSVVTANGVSGSVANPSTTPAITLTLGDISAATSKPPSGTARSFESRNADIFNVKDYGALGTGGDDSTAINAAINAINSSNYGGVLYFPAGTYGMGTTALTTITKSVKILGDGIGVTIIALAATLDGFNINFSAAPGPRFASAYDFTITTENSTAANTAITFRQKAGGTTKQSFEFCALSIEGCWSKGIFINNASLNDSQGGTIRDIALVGTQGATTAFAHGIYVAGASNINIQGVKLTEGVIGCYISSSCEGVWVSDCIFVNTRYGVEAVGANSWLTNVHVNVSQVYTTSSVGYGFLVTGNQSILTSCYMLTDKTTTIAFNINATEVNMTNCLALRTSSTMTNGLLMGSSCGQCVISNNHFQAISGPAIVCNGHNNIIEGNYYTDCAATYPINDTTGSNNVIINNYNSNSAKIEANSSSLSPVGYVASVTWDPASLVPGQQDFVSVAAPGAAFGQAWVVGVPYDMQNMITVAFVIAAGFVRITVFNSSSSIVNLGSGTWTVTRVS